MLVRRPALATPSSFHGRPLPATCVGHASNEGKRRFAEALVAGSCEAFFPLSEQFITQDEPAFCGVSSLCMVLNALRVDPGPTRPSVSPIICGLVSVTCLGTNRQTASAQWREDGVWRWFDESVLDLSAPAMLAAGKVTLSCIKEVGVTLDQFTSLAEHNGARVQMYRPEDSSEAQFRSQLIRASRVHAAPHIVVAFRCTHPQSMLTSQQDHRTKGHSSSESVLVMHVYTSADAPSRRQATATSHLSLATTPRPTPYSC